jgi:hypothetical protein
LLTEFIKISEEVYARAWGIWNGGNIYLSD